MRVGSLFAGIGGFDLGFERAGMTTAWQVEIDEKARGVLATHFPQAQRSVKDVRDAAGLPAVDVICGGFPCQDISVAGRRAGLAGERSGLWFEFQRVLAALQPDWCVIENVPGLLSSNGGRDFAVILHGLGVIGYRVCWRVLDAQYFGVAQRRRRVFVVGHLGDGRAASVLLESEGGGGNPRSQFEAWQATPALFASGAGTGRTASAGSEARYCIPVEVAPIAWALQERDAKGADSGTKDGHLIPVISPPLSSEGHDSSEDGNGRHALIPVVALDLQNATRTTDKSKQNRQGVGISQEGAPSPTITQDFIPGVGTPNAVRRLTPIECERLQGFPDGWTAGQSDSARYRQLGNAVCVNVAEWIGRRMMEVM